MKVGFTVMIQKQRNNCCNETAQNHQEQKRLAGPSSKKGTLIVFFDMKGIVHGEFVPPNTMVNSDFYCDVLRRMRENVRQKRPELWCNHNWLLHHDNAPDHTNNMVFVPHPPYSPDLSPLFYFVFQIENETERTKFWKCLTSKGNRKRYSTALRKMTSTVLLKNGKNDGIAVYISNVTILK
jgi:hypothetical protein